MNCLKCGNSCAASTAFCPQCGNRLIDEPNTATAAATATATAKATANSTSSNELGRELGRAAGPIVEKVWSAALKLAAFIASLVSAIGAKTATKFPRVGQVLSAAGEKGQTRRGQIVILALILFTPILFFVGRPSPYAGAAAVATDVPEQYLDAPQRVAANFRRAMLQGPACEAFASNIERIADSNMPENIRYDGVKRLVGGAMQAGCLP